MCQVGTFTLKNNSGYVIYYKSGLKHYYYYFCMYSNKYYCLLKKKKYGDFYCILVLVLLLENFLEGLGGKCPPPPQTPVPSAPEFNKYIFLYVNELNIL